MTPWQHMRCSLGYILWFLAKFSSCDTWHFGVGEPSLKTSALMVFSCPEQTSGKHANTWINLEAAYIAGGQQHLKLLYFNDTSGRSSLFVKTLSHYYLVYALMYLKFKITSHIGRRPMNLIKHIRRPLPAFLRYGPEQL